MTDDASQLWFCAAVGATWWFRAQWCEQENFRCFCLAAYSSCWLFNLLLVNELELELVRNRAQNV